MSSRNRRNPGSTSSSVGHRQGVLFHVGLAACDAGLGHRGLGGLQVGVGDVAQLIRIGAVAGIGDDIAEELPLWGNQVIAI